MPETAIFLLSVSDVTMVFLDPDFLKDAKFRRFVVRARCRRKKFTFAVSSRDGLLVICPMLDTVAMGQIKIIASTQGPWI